MPDKIFFSYSRFDSVFALKLANDLRLAGASIWLDQLDIPAGQRWDNAIEQALNNANCLLAIISPKSLQSDNAMDEISYALEEKKRVIPIMLTDADLSFRLRRLQRIDFTGEYDAGFEQLLTTLNLKKSDPPVSTQTQKNDECQHAYNIIDLEEERELWQNCIELQSVDAYKLYLKKSVVRSHIDEACQALASLQTLDESRKINFPKQTTGIKKSYSRKVLLTMVPVLLALLGLGYFSFISPNSVRPKAGSVQVADTNAINTKSGEKMKKDEEDVSTDIEIKDEQKHRVVENEKPDNTRARQTTVKKAGKITLVETNKTETKDIPQDNSGDTAASSSKSEPTIEPNKMPAEVVLASQLQVSLVLKDKLVIHGRDKSDQVVKFEVSRDVECQGHLLIAKGSVVRGSINVGNILADIRLNSVESVNGQMLSIKPIRFREKKKDMETKKNYEAYIAEGTKVKL